MSFVLTEVVPTELVLTEMIPFSVPEFDPASLVLCQKGLEWGNLALEGYVFKTQDELEEEEVRELNSRPDLTLKEEALMNYVAPPIASLEELLEEFPIFYEEEARVGGVGPKRLRLYWNVERLENARNTTPFMTMDHHCAFEGYTRERLLFTLQERFKSLVVVSEEKDDGMGGSPLAVLTVKDRLLPLQKLMKGPFVWDQEGAIVGVRVHHKKMEALGGFRPVRTAAEAKAYDAFVQKMASAMSEWMVADEEVSIEPNTNPAFLFRVCIPVNDDDVPVKKPVAKVVAPITATAATVGTATTVGTVAVAKAKAPITATATATVGAAAAAATGPKARDVLMRDGRVVWKRYADAECRREDGRGYFHAVEVKRICQRDARRIDDELFAALKRCPDCKLTPPPAGSPFLFVVQLVGAC
jgi:hypothetical protein